MWMLQRDVLEALEFGYRAIADDLYLWLVWDGLQIWVENGSFCIDSLAMAVRLSLGVETLSEFELCSWREILLVLEDDDLVS